jgi:hypothetical protein
VSDDRLQNIIDTVDNIFIRHEHGELLSDRDINSVIDDIGTLFDDNAKNIFGTKCSLSHDDSNVRPHITLFVLVLLTSFWYGQNYHCNKK